jgi:16S rRNA (guanine527-N7)-methyltransferase
MRLTDWALGGNFVTRSLIRILGHVPEVIRETLDALAQSWGVTLPAGARDGLLNYADLLLTWNARVNLTAAKRAEEVVGEHMVDAFAMARLVPRQMEVCDVGSGGGLPGIPFALLRPDCQVTMVEPRAKRVAFLRTAVRELSLAQTQVVRGRAEEVECRFDVAGARATFGPDEWLRLGATLVREGGLVLVFASGAVECRAGWTTAESLEYRTESGHSRWLGAFRTPTPRS